MSAYRRSLMERSNGRNYRPERRGQQYEQRQAAFDSAEIARSTVLALEQPPHVRIAEMMILPVNRY